MAESHVVRPESARLSLSTGEFVDVTKELNAGEYWDLLQALAARAPFAKIVAYVIGWSLVGLDGQPLPYSLDLPEALRRDTVRALNKRIVRELVAQIDRHEQAVDAAYEAKKKTSAAAPASAPTGTSPDGPA
jgi:hypothetical protein